MLIILTKCDNCGKVDDAFLCRESPSHSWRLTETGREQNPKRQDACSKECAIALGTTKGQKSVDLTKT